MSQNEETNPKIHISTNGTIYVDANELFQLPQVRQFLDEMDGIERKQRASQKMPEISNTKD